MEIIQYIGKVYQQFFSFGLIMARIVSLLVIFNFFRREIITTRTALAFSFVLSLMVLMTHQHLVAYYNLGLQFFINMLFQIFIGVMGGLILNLVFETFVVLGQFLSTQIGLSAASLIDPRFGSITSLTQFYVICSILLFLMMNGHLYIIKTAVDSFNYLPISDFSVNKDLLVEILLYAKVIFSGAITLSLTVLMIILLSNISLAIMSKFAPQFNVFSIGISLSLIMGLSLIYITFQMFVSAGHDLLLNGLQFFLHGLTRLAAHG